MAKFIKEVKREVLDVEGIKKAVLWHKAMSAKPPRMVISHETEKELCMCFLHYGVRISDCVNRDNASDSTSARMAFNHFKTFDGCTIDYNDGLSFGEILFTVEL